MGNAAASAQRKASGLAGDLHLGRLTTVLDPLGAALGRKMGRFGAVAGPGGAVTTGAPGISPTGDELPTASSFVPNGALQDTAPVVTPPTVMPVPGQDDLANIAARRRSIQAQLARRGRLSTILSQPQSEPLGG